MVKSHLLGAVGIVAVVGGLAGVQAQAPASPAFEVASVKPNQSGSQFAMLAFRPGGYFNADNIRLQDLIIIAFHTDPPLKDSQVIGLPSWAPSSRYDISAKTFADAPQDAASLLKQQPAYLKGLLEERFALKAHKEVRDLPIYALTVAAADGHLGPHLRASTVDCFALGQAFRDARDAGRTSPPIPPSLQTCGIRPPGSGAFAGAGIPLATLISTLVNAVGRPVADRTNLRGTFDIELQWAAGPDVLAADPAAVSAMDRSFVFTAVQEQLGLKLESTRGPVEVLVIDHVERPTAD